MFAVYAAEPKPDAPLDALVVGERPDPDVPDGSVAVHVEAASLNMHDLWTLRGVGIKKEQFPMILGCDGAGRLDDGTEVVIYPVIGDPTIAGDETLDPRRSLLTERLQGTFADVVVVPARNVVPRPAGLTAVQSSVMGTAWLTAYRMLFVKSGLRPGQTMLVQGASGGVSTALVQLGRAAGLQVWVTGRTEEKRALAAKLGAHATFPNGERLPERVDAVFETVGDATWAHSMRSLKPGGIIVVSGVHQRRRTPGPTCSDCSSCSCGWWARRWAPEPSSPISSPSSPTPESFPRSGSNCPCSGPRRGSGPSLRGRPAERSCSRAETGATRSRTHPAFGCGALGHQQVQSVTVSEPSSRTASGSVYVPAPRVTGLVELLDRVDRAVAAALVPVTTAEGVSRDGWRVLLMLARGGGRSMGEIASHTALPAPTATRVVDKLVDSGFASRRTDPVDRRRVLVHLAANGRAVIERVCGRVERKIGAALGSAHTPERAQLAELLEALARRPSGS